MGSKDQDNGNQGSMLASPVPDQDTSASEPETDDTQGGAVMDTDQTVQDSDEGIPEPVAQEVDDSDDPPGGDSVFDGSAEELPQAQPAEEDGSGRPEGAESGDQPSPLSGDGGGDGNGDDQSPDMPPPPEPPADSSTQKRWFARRKFWWIFGAVLLVAALVTLGLRYYDGFGGDGDADPVEPAGAGLAAEEMTSCREQSAVNLERVGVLTYGDSLVYNTINPFWTANPITDGDAEAVLEGAVDELWRTVQDGCSPAGAAYWRLIRAHVIDAARPGIDNFDSATRIAAYTEETDTRVAVAEETAAQLSSCVSVEYVELSVEEAPRIHIAAYADDYEDIVFVETPLLQLDELSNGDQGLIVIRCAFGEIEGASGGIANETLISPSLRAIVYLDQPTGAPPVQVIPDPATDDEQDVPEREEEPEKVPEEPTAAPEVTPEPAGPEATEATEERQTATEEDASRTQEEAAAEVTPETEQVPEPETEETPSTPEAPQPAEEAPVSESTTETAVGEVSEEPTGPEPTKPEAEVPAVAEDPEPTEQQPADDQQDEPVVGQPEPAAEPEPEPEQTPAVSQEEEADDETQTAGQPGDQAEVQQPSDTSGGGCGGSCGTNGDDQSGGTSGTSGTKGSGDGTGGDGDCVAGDGSCPGDGDGDDGGDGDGDGDGDDGGGDPPPACQPGEILDPFGNCKSADPGSGGF